MKCFIASAFGRDDVDAIYDQVIRPVLRELHIQPLRVDREEHNDDIDKKIMSMMSEADLCIADLTYARPSAYYEAGYMIASKPVVFIARKDHFRQRDNDIHGNETVHFDLKMKNIIDWTKPSLSLRKRIKRRIQKVIRPFIRAQKTKTENTSRQQDFSRLAHSKQLTAIETSATQILRKAKFQEQPLDARQQHRGKRYLRARSKDWLHVTVVPEISFKKSTLWFFNQYGSPPVTAEELSRFARFRSVIVFCSPNPIRKTMFRSYFRSHDELSDGSLFLQIESEKSPGRHLGKSILFIEKIRSGHDFGERLASTLSSFIST